MRRLQLVLHLRPLRLHFFFLAHKRVDEQPVSGAAASTNATSRIAVLRVICMCVSFVPFAVLRALRLKPEPHHRLLLAETVTIPLRRPRPRSGRRQNPKAAAEATAATAPASAAEAATAAVVASTPEGARRRSTSRSSRRHPIAAGRAGRARQIG